MMIPAFSRYLAQLAPTLRLMYGLGWYTGFVQRLTDVNNMGDLSTEDQRRVKDAERRAKKYS